jgi:hypothetical protein
MRAAENRANVEETAPHAVDLGIAGTKVRLQIAPRG